MFVCLITIDHTLLSMFCSRFITLWKSPMNPPLASEITAFESPLPLTISNDLPWGGGGGGGGYGYFLEPHNTCKSISNNKAI